MKSKRLLRRGTVFLLCGALLLLTACGGNTASSSPADSSGFSGPSGSSASSAGTSGTSGESGATGEDGKTQGTTSGSGGGGGGGGDAGQNGGPTSPPSGSSGSSQPDTPAASGTPLDSISADDGITSTFFGSVEIEERNSYTAPGSSGDLWPGAWSDDGYLYVANGDGPGFGSVNADIAVGRISGTPSTGLRGEGLACGDAVAEVWSGSQFNRKPTGMVSVGGVLYLAVQDLRSTSNGIFDEAPAASIYQSTDKGRTWTGTDEPMFDDYVFTTILFLDYGQDNENSPDGYVYAYGLDNNWRDSFSGLVDDPVSLYLARVPADGVMDRSKWEFFSGTSSSPSWSRDINARKPVLTDTRRVYERVTSGVPSVRDMSVISQGSIVYNEPLDRYIYTSWTEYTYEFYESPTPYGPFKLFARKDFGAYPWNSQKYGGYGCVIPSKFISADGLEMYIVSNTFVDGVNQYGYNMRKMTVTLASSAQANNAKGPKNLAADGSLNPVVISTSNGNGRPHRLNDGSLEYEEQSWTGEMKDIDYWGYSFRKVCRFNTIEYTTGEMKNDGGWFATLGVQVRQNGKWVNVSGGTVSPRYPKTMSTGSNTTYTIRFDEISGDAVRIIGRPGGSMRYTTISELAVYYR